MKKLKINLDSLKNIISLKEEYWEYCFDTNCYAFALGLDIPESNILENAYQLGVIGSLIYNISITELKNMTYEQRLLLDLKALKIICKETSPEDKTDCKFNFKNNKLTSIEQQWIIALFDNGEDFHFMRKSYDGIWYHKRGFFAPPINYDNNKQIITNPEECIIDNYKYVKTYKLMYREKY